MFTMTISRSTLPLIVMAVCLGSVSLALLAFSQEVDQDERPDPGLAPELAQQLAQLLDRDWQQQPEWGRMMVAILRGEEMRIGSGWFAPSQSRYDWRWLAERFDGDGDGTIGLADLPEGPLRQLCFDRLNTTADSVLTADDLRAPRRAPNDQLAGPLFYRLDANSNGRVSAAEMTAFFEKADRDQSGFLTPDDLQLALTAPRSERRQDSASRPSVTDWLTMLLRGQLGSLTPDLDETAPDFRLKTMDGAQTVSLSDFRGKKPVVLVFGSFT